ncbi:MAG: phospho-N-acetylmuramoyl-pentapeptide-transferase [Planctomycetota bacterium]|nr:phospho-N-acetylmuramoyl-pentapeptide-transferase [bacterium]MDG2309372.1 phospho-N-acetylmuramoyl-pentapeptide-transferase [Planctomycetota bacterium]
MINWLIPFLSDLFSPFAAFSYIGVRAGAAFIFSFAVALVIGKPLINRLRESKVGERTDNSDCDEVAEAYRQAGKDGTPTMGGVFWLASVLISTMVFGRIDEPLVLIGMVLMVGMGTIGFFDDQVKANPNDPRKGLSRKAKMVPTLLLTLLVVGLLWKLGDAPGSYPELRYIFMPVFKDMVIGPGMGLLVLGGVFFVIQIMCILGFSHAANVTDGLDGLAVGSAVPVLAAMGLSTYFVGHANFSEYLHLPFIPGSGEVTVLVAATLGASLGFLWFNSSPALIFMGDSGSLPLGAAMAYFAIVSKQEILLILIGGVFTIEVASSLLQILCCKYFNWRPFRKAPIHHIWQLDKMPEARIVARFWIVSALFASLGLLLIKLR